MTPTLSAWRYETDGERHDRTHYAIRDSADAPCGVERIDFKTAETARQFVRNSNNLIFRILNDKQRPNERAR